MAAVMEGTHTILLLYAPIHEFSNISPYFPKRRISGFKYKSRTPHSVGAGNDHDWAKQDPAVSEQRGQSSDSSGKLLNSQQATKEAVAKLCWLAAEHQQLLADLLSLCGDCAVRVGMGNQDGKLQDYVEGQEVPLGGQVPDNGGCPASVSPENRRGTSKSKKAGGRRFDSAEDFLHNKKTKKVLSGNSTAELPGQTSAPLSVALGEERIPAAPAGPMIGGARDPILPMEEPFQIGRDGWDLIADNRTFDPDMDFCSDFSEYDGELGYGSSSCSLMEGLTRRESGSNIRPIKRFDSPVNALAAKSAQQLYGEVSQRNPGVRVVAKVQDVEGRVQRVCHTSPERSGPIVPHPGTSSSKVDYREWRGGLQLPLSSAVSPSPSARSQTKSPSPPSLAAVFNTSFPASNSLHSMSPVLSPLSSKQPSPQLNHRLVLLPDPDGDDAGAADEPKRFTEAVDQNGNKRTVARLDLNLGSRRPSSSRWKSSSKPTATGELLDIAL